MSRPGDRPARGASRWPRLDPARAGGLTEVARLLLAAGADPAARPDGEGRQWSPLLCAVAGASNPAITRLLLEHGARPDDHVLYLAAFDGSHECLRLLLPYAPDITATTALQKKMKLMRRITGNESSISPCHDNRRRLRDRRAGQTGR